MKLLLFSDIHRDEKATIRIVEMSKSVDVVVGAGDFATMRRGLTKIIRTLAQIDTPTVLVPGNSESYDELCSAIDSWPSANVLHGTGIDLLEQPFFGIGGGIPVTPFGSWSYDFDEEQARKLLAPCENNCVLVSHSPPLGFCDVSSTGKSFGSRSIKMAVEKCKPRLVVCGHIHESWERIEFLGSTPVVNAGPRGLIWDLNLGQPIE